MIGFGDYPPAAPPSAPRESTGSRPPAILSAMREMHGVIAARSTGLMQEAH